MLILPKLNGATKLSTNAAVIGIYSKGRYAPRSTRHMEDVDFLDSHMGYSVLKTYFEKKLTRPLVTYQPLPVLPMTS